MNKSMKHLFLFNQGTFIEHQKCAWSCEMFWWRHKKIKKIYKYQRIFNNIDKEVLILKHDIRVQKETVGKSFPEMTFELLPGDEYVFAWDRGKCITNKAQHEQKYKTEGFLEQHGVSCGWHTAVCGE